MVDHKLTKSVGEHWTCSMLARAGWSPALTRDGIARTDILAVATHIETRPAIEIQVKTATGSGRNTNWALGKNTQDLDRSGREWFVLVAVPPLPAPARGFVVPRNHLAAAVWIDHRNWLTMPGVPSGTRNAPLEQARVQLSVFEAYENRWDLLDEETHSTPILLPSWLRACCTEPRVGLPPGHPWNGSLPNW